MNKPTLHSITKDGQKPNPTDPEEELDYHVEVSSAANVFRFFEEYFNVVGDGTAKVTEADGYALAHIFGLCSKRLYSVLWRRLNLQNPEHWAACLFGGGPLSRCRACPPPVPRQDGKWLESFKGS